MLVLGIESSCDETAASVVGPEGVLSDVVHSQEVHTAYGGVVPELAARAHTERLVAVVRAALAEAGVERVDGVCATAGPGLMGAVLTGFCFAKGYALARSLPFCSVNHLEGHLLSSLLEDPAPQFPFLGLVVSGGHTALYLAEGLGDYKLLGHTVDDAAGEAFDKVARMMGLDYPGGPVIDRLAAEATSPVLFPRPDPGGLNWSFSGLKTAVKTHLQRVDSHPSDVAAGFQDAVVDCLLDRVRRAMKSTGVRRVTLSGGVGANSQLRAAFQQLPGEVFLPPKHRCTDNGAMIAHVGRLHLLAGSTDAADAPTRPRWAVETP